MHEQAGVDNEPLKILDTKELQGPDLLRGVKSLSAERVFGQSNATVTTSPEAEILLKFRETPLSVRMAFGKGMVYLLSCLTVLGKKHGAAMSGIGSSRTRF